MLTRASLAISASAFAALAAVVASLDGDADIVPFFVGLTFAGGVAAWALHEPISASRRLVAKGIGAVWVIAAVWIGALLVWAGVLCGCSYPVRPPEATYLGLTATVYHLVGLYLGGALMFVAAYSRRRWIAGGPSRPPA